MCIDRSMWNINSISAFMINAVGFKRIIGFLCCFLFLALRSVLEPERVDDFPHRRNQDSQSRDSWDSQGNVFLCLIFCLIDGLFFCFWNKSWSLGKKKEELKSLTLINCGSFRIEGFLYKDVGNRSILYGLQFGLAKAMSPVVNEFFWIYNKDAENIPKLEVLVESSCMPFVLRSQKSLISCSLLSSLYGSDKLIHGI